MTFIRTPDGSCSYPSDGKLTQHQSMESGHKK
jgi:hypothetical protein